MYANNVNQPIAPASLTKLLTSLVILDSFNLGDNIVVTLPEDYVYEGKVAYLESGQIMTIESLLEFILIYSANDACFVAAVNVAGNVNDFILLMNNKAKELGMKDTNFVNPDGLDSQGHVTTINDLLILSKEVLENIELLTIIMKPSFISDIGGSDKVYLNTNQLINENYLGLKTGWTKEAGLTFIGVNQSNNRNILTIVNKSIVNDKKDNHFLDTKILYSVSIDSFINKILIDDKEDIYRIRNSTQTINIKSNEPWIVFGNKYTKNKFYLNKVSTNSIEYKVNENTFNIKFDKSFDDKIWQFNLRNFMLLNAN